MEIYIPRKVQECRGMLWNVMKRGGMGLHPHIKAVSSRSSETVCDGLKRVETPAEGGSKKFGSLCP